VSVPPCSGASDDESAAAAAAAASAATPTIGSVRAAATSAVPARSTAAPRASSWFVPSSGISTNAVANVPTMLPTVETAKSRPAVRPSVATSSAAIRTAMGVTAARTTLIGPKRIDAATRGFRRAPGSQSTTKRRTRPSSYGIASTSRAPSDITASRRPVDGRRSASAPPSQ
jgi:hypothetical protein